MVYGAFTVTVQATNGRNYMEIRSDTIRREERLPNGYWRFDMVSGLVHLARTIEQRDAIRRSSQADHKRDD